MKINFFFYNVVPVKTNLNSIPWIAESLNILFASEFAISSLSEENVKCFSAIHKITRNMQQPSLKEIDSVFSFYVDKFGPDNIRILTNEDSTQIVCAQLREKYKIKGASVEYLLPFVDKSVSKTSLLGVVKIPKHLLFNKIDFILDGGKYLSWLESYVDYPLFIKPINLVSSLNTFKVESRKDAFDVLSNLVRTEYSYEIDEFIFGDVLHADIVMIDGEVDFLGVGRNNIPLHLFQHGNPAGSFPEVDDLFVAKAHDFSRKILKKLQADNGVFHLEFFQQANGELVFLEVAARMGGAHIFDIYKIMHGFDLEELCLSLQAGEYTISNKQKKDLFAAFVNYPKKEGVVSYFKEPDIKSSFKIIKRVSEGEVVSKAKTLLDSTASIIIWSLSLSQLRRDFDTLSSFEPVIFVE